MTLESRYYDAVDSAVDLRDLDQACLGRPRNPSLLQNTPPYAKEKDGLP